MNVKSHNHFRRRVSRLGAVLAAFTVLSFGLPAASSAQGPADEATESTDATMAPLHQAGNKAIDGTYIVYFDDGVDLAGVDRLADAVVADGASITYRYSELITGFAAENVDAETLAMIRRYPGIDQVAEAGVSSRPTNPVARTSDTSAVASQAAISSWALDRIDEPYYPLDGRYSPPNDGAGVDIFILDSGIFRAHDEFGGRVKGGQNFSRDRLNLDGTIKGDSWGDCGGPDGNLLDAHGTAVAGAAAGRTLGVAQNANLFSVRVTNCLGFASDPAVVAGIEWVSRIARTTGRPAVVNFSSGDTTVGIAPAMSRLIGTEGISLVLAAGNENDKACNYWPAALIPAITVAATKKSPQDYRWEDSNFGRCVDLFAPGEKVLTAADADPDDDDDDDPILEATGTSFAAPLVTGAIAMYLKGNPNATPSEIKSTLLAAATPNVVQDKGSDSPNLLLNVNLGGPSREPTPCQGKRPTIVSEGVIQGTAGDDVILGSGGDDTIYGNGGNDTNCALSGNDTVHGGPGNDSIEAGSGNDTVNGNDGDDTLYGQDGDDQLNGQDGRDTIDGGTGSDRIDAGSGNDIVRGGSGNDTVFAGPGNDTVNGNDGDDQIAADEGNDTIDGGNNDDRIDAGLGDDIVNGGSGNDVVIGGDGNDRLNGQVGLDRIFGGAGNDALDGGHDNDTINGGPGTDAIDGGTGNDTIEGGNENDRILGSGGNDRINAGHGADRVFGGNGIDVIDGGTGDDIIDGDTGHDTIMGGAGDDLVRGGPGNDTIRGEEGSDKLFGQDGADKLFGNDGADELYGGIHADQLNGGAGPDAIYGSDGPDVVTAGPGADTVYGGVGNDRIDGGQGADTIVGNAGIDRIEGGRDNDTIDGQAGDDIISGGDGNDIIRGGAGLDKIWGADGNDRIWGMAGNDTLIGSLGDDFIDGGHDTDDCNGNGGTDQAINCEIVSQVP